MRKRVLLVLLAMMVALAMMPAIAMAGTDQTAGSKSGAQTKVGKDAILFNNNTPAEIGDKDKPVPGATGGTYSYDGTTLTLKNVQFKSTDAEFLYASCDTVIELQGENVIECAGTYTKLKGLDSAAITGDQSGLTFKGTGSLDVTSYTAHAIIAYRIQVDSGSIKAKSDEGYGIGAVNDITINGGSIYGEGAIGIYAGTININGGKLGGVAAATTPKETKSIKWPAVATHNGNITLGSDVVITKPVGGVIGAFAGLSGMPGRGQTKVNATSGQAVYEKDGKTFATDVSIEKPLKVPAAPVIKAKTNGKTKIKVSWNKVEGATGYILYKATKKKGKYTEIDRMTGTSKIVKKLKSNKKYYFKAQAYNNDGTGAYSNIASARTKKATAQRPDAFFKLSKATFFGITAVKVKWRSQPGAIEYQIADNHTKSGKMKIQWTGDNSMNTYWSIWKKSGKTYKYQMRYSKKKAGNKVWTKWTKIKKIKR